MVAGPNGSGKSTFALEYLPTFAGSIEYVNPDMMAKGLSPVSRYASMASHVAASEASCIWRTSSGSSSILLIVQGPFA